MTAAGVSFGLLRNVPSATAGQAQVCVPAGEDGGCEDGRQKVSNPLNVATCNGCGGDGSPFRPPQSFFGTAPFTVPCNHHDTCYEDCGKTKAQCDDQFQEELSQSCLAAYNEDEVLAGGACFATAAAYATFVRQAGEEFWSGGQQKACLCCKSQVYCACTNKCYTEVGLCIAECRVSLGCFTGVCGPAEPGQCPGAPPPDRRPQVDPQCT